MLPNFLVDHKTVHQRVSGINPITYARTRNYLDGSVTYLSPFITHGIISTRTIATAVLNNYTTTDAKKLLSELAWREYFHRVWQTNGSDIFSDLKHPQALVSSDRLPAAIANATTTIDAVDNAVMTLTRAGYMHNHARMWVAAICCNTGRTHWHHPARWLYYHLLDGDLASNTLSWQWIAGSFSHRKYIANQHNLNRYSRSVQSGTFLDLEYDERNNCAVPPLLEPRIDLTLSNEFPQSTAEPLHRSADPVYLYSIWNLDRDWQQGRKGHRILWIEPDMHRDFALSPLRWNFIKHWADTIDGLKIFVGDQDALFPQGVAHLALYTRENPATAHWPGQRDERDWCFANPPTPLKSFSNFWKQISKSSNLDIL